MSVATGNNRSTLVIDSGMAIGTSPDTVAQSRLVLSTRQSTLRALGYWAAWVAFGAWAVRCDPYYLMNGWWMVLVAFWFTANAVNPAPLLSGRLRFFSLSLATITAAFLIYGTFEWLEEITDGWSWGPPGQRFRLVAIPVVGIHG